MTDQPASPAALAASLPLVQGRCPACGGSSLFLGDGGYVTCSRIDCPNPSAPDELLHGDDGMKAKVDEATSTLRRVRRAHLCDDCRVNVDAVLSGPRPDPPTAVIPAQPPRNGDTMTARLIRLLTRRNRRHDCPPRTFDEGVADLLAALDQLAAPAEHRPAEEQQ